MKSPHNPAQISEHVLHWVESIVIGLQLCPFAQPVVRREQLNLIVCEHRDAQNCLQQFADEAASLAAGDAQATTLFIIPEGYEDFDDYLDLLAMANALLEDLFPEGVLQLASFHPQYQFEGADIDDVANWTNRAPYPILHLLTEESVELAVLRHPDPESIPQTNIERLNALGLKRILDLLTQ